MRPTRRGTNTYKVDLLIYPEVLERTKPFVQHLLSTEPEGWGEERTGETYMCGAKLCHSCDVGQLLPSLRDRGTCLDEDGWRYPERCALGCLMVSSTGTQPFPHSLLFPVVVSVSPRTRHRSRLPRVGGKRGRQDCVTGNPR